MCRDSPARVWQQILNYANNKEIWPNWEETTPSAALKMSLTLFSGELMDSSQEFRKPSLLLDYNSQESYLHSPSPHLPGEDCQFPTK